MILYFADRQLNIIGQASTSLPKGLLVTNDKKIEDTETGVATFECKIHFDDDTRSKVEEIAEVGNYLLRSHDNENELYSIIDSEFDTKKQTLYIYAEDDGMDLLNEIVGEYEAEEAYPIEHYINMYAASAGFVIGVNEVKTLTRKLSWDSESTATERIASIATQFDGCEVSYSFDIDGLYVVKKKINIYKERGKDIGVTLYLNKDVDNILISKSIANLATALRSTGGTIDQSSTILEATTSSTPKVAYTVDFETKSRTANTVKILATISAVLTNEDAELGEDYGLKASIYIGGSWRAVTIKSTKEDDKQSWSGTGSYSTDFEFTVSDVSAGVATISDIKFKVERTDSKGGSAGVLASTNCEKWIVPNYISGAKKGENDEDINNRSITIEGYVYDDGDFYVEGKSLKSRNALKKWARALWKTEESQKSGGHITKTYSYDTFDQKTLCEKTITELKKLRDMEANYEADIMRLPDNVKIGDRINIVDDKGNLYLSARLLQLETSVVNREHKATLGEHLIKTSGISQKVADLAAQFTKTSQSAARALNVSNNAKAIATDAQNRANRATVDAVDALKKSVEATATANTAQESAAAAQIAADAAQSAVTVVEKNVASMGQTLDNAHAAAQQAFQASETAQQKANEAAAAAQNAVTEATAAKNASTEAQGKAETAISNAETAQNTANTAKTEAEAAKDTADAAKLDAKQAQEDVNSLGDRLETVVDTMEADYTRKTELTETTAHLQSQITKNAAGITETFSQLTVIDETANDAQKQLQGAIEWANIAEAQAEKAQADAEEAQSLADDATQAAANAQSEADTAKAAAATARSVADKAEQDLAAAQADLETIQSRADATEAEIAAAQEAVNIAQAAADKAQADADTAVQVAEEAQKTAEQAVADADYAQTVANNAASQANVAQQNADAAKGDATAAQAAADEAAAIAAEAQRTADTAVTTSINAQIAANAAAQAAEEAQAQADDAEARADQAQADLTAAEQNLAEILARAEATEEEIAAAQLAVTDAQAAATSAQNEADTAQENADTARADAEAAQAQADNAKRAADEATAAAEEAKRAADEAEVAVNGLAVRVINAGAEISRNANEIALKASKEEVAETLGGYSTKEQTAAAIKVESDAITQTVSSVEDTANDTQSRVTAAESIIEQLSDSISMLVTDSNGESLMKQTANGWTFSTKAIQDAVNNTAAGLGTLEKEVGGIDETVGVLQSTVDDLGAIAEYVKIGNYTYTDVNGEMRTEPCIDLGERDTGFRLKITNTRISFTDGANTLVHIDSTDKSLTTDKIVVNEIQIGNIVIRTRANGNTGISWKGAD